MGLGLQNAFGLENAQQGLRQRIIDQLNQQKQQQEMQLAERRMVMQETEQKAREQDRGDLAKSLVEQRQAQQQQGEDTRAVNAFTLSPAGAQLPGKMAGRLQSLGYPVATTPGVSGPATTAGLPSDMGGGGATALPSEATPMTFQRGQTQGDVDKQTAITVAQQARQEAIDARDAQAKQQIAARAEQAGQQRDLSLQIATMGNETRRDVAAGNAANIRSKEQDKKDAADKERMGKRQAALRAVGDTEDALSELLDVQTDASGKEVYALKPGVSQLYGARIPGLSMIPGTDTSNALASMNRLRGRMVTDLLGELKAQSRTGATGFGALSEKELSILQSSASKLENSGMSDTDVLNELVRIRERLKLAKQEPGAPSQNGSAPGGLPTVGSTFQGGKVLKVEKVQ